MTSFKNGRFALISLFRDNNTNGTLNLRFPTQAVTHVDQYRFHENNNTSYFFLQATKI
jgi:hypothetical protein